MKITLQMLIDANACREGLDQFTADYPEGIADWTREAQLSLMTTGCRRYLGWAVAQHIVPWWSMSGADLTDADLSDADLSDATMPVDYCA